MCAMSWPKGNVPMLQPTQLSIVAATDQSMGILWVVLNAQHGRGWLQSHFRMIGIAYSTKQVQIRTSASHTVCGMLPKSYMRSTYTCRLNGVPSLHFPTVAPNSYPVGRPSFKIWQSSLWSNRQQYMHYSRLAGHPPLAGFLLRHV